MDKKIMLIISTLIVSALFISGCTGFADDVDDFIDDVTDNDEDGIVKTFNCDSTATADLHLISGDCENPQERFHVYDLGRELVLTHIEGDVTIGYDGGGAGTVLFYMANVNPPYFGDIDWIRVFATYNQQTSFDNDVPANDRLYKVTGRYLIIGCSPDKYMRLTRGTAIFAEPEG